jgi:ATP-dependent DNA helicase RecQ
MPDDERHLVQDRFARDEVDVIVATVAFGMGIDKSNVRFVVHRDMPKSVEAWYQEIGRAGRDGLPSDCVLLYSWADVIGYERFLEGIADEAVREETRGKTVQMFRMVDAGGCRHQALVRHFDETIEPCGGSCDTCRGVALDDLAAPARGAERRGVLGGAGTGAGRADAAEITDPELFERLRALRKRLADAESVPAYIVFSDAVLRQMARCVPKTKDEMLLISGVGPAKLARYGDAFLEEIRAGAERSDPS